VVRQSQEEGKARAKSFNHIIRSILTTSITLKACTIIYHHGGQDQELRLEQERIYVDGFTRRRVDIFTNYLETPMGKEELHAMCAELAKLRAKEKQKARRNSFRNLIGLDVVNEESKAHEPPTEDDHHKEDLPDPKPPDTTADARRFLEKKDSSIKNGSSDLDSPEKQLKNLGLVGSLHKMFSDKMMGLTIIGSSQPDLKTQQSLQRKDTLVGMEKEQVQQVFEMFDGKVVVTICGGSDIKSY